MILPENIILEIVSAKYFEKYRITLIFNDGKKSTIDFEPFLKNSSNPQIQKYLDLELFQEFKLDYGDLIWNDFDLCFPIADLYEGNI